ncbi:hypothetical protein FQN60_008561 [Etheostoma spectabile]|uniref:Galectin n=1 Tax=Etheostoma spectabile TaxID=54343 RepID=A0A5J5CPQ1_9PERO|nr:hypothetical protein FQN60_008561 [Etheostoma spectabile]
MRASHRGRSNELRILSSFRGPSLAAHRASHSASSCPLLAPGLCGITDNTEQQELQLSPDVERNLKWTLWHTGIGQLPLSMLQAPLEVLKQLLKGGLSLTAEGMHGYFHRDTPLLSRGVCQLEAESIRPQLASSLGTSTLHHALSGMEENDKKENGEYTGEIKGGMRPSMKLVVMGIINKKPNSEPQEEDSEGDVGLQLKVSFMDKAVQRNARMAGKWGRPETTLSYFPFAPGESFKMEIVCEHQQFRILVDGQPLCGFSHRVLRLASLTALRVCGDLQLTKSIFCCSVGAWMK